MSTDPDADTVPVSRSLLAAIEKARIGTWNQHEGRAASYRLQLNDLLTLLPKGPRP